MIEIYLNESFVYNNKLWHLIWNLNLFLEYNANLSSSFYRKQKTSAYRISKVFNQSSNPIFHHLLRHIKQLVSHHPFQFDCVSLFRSSSPYIIDPFLTGNKELVALFCNMKGALSLFPDPVQVGNYFYPRFLSPIFFFFWCINPNRFCLQPEHQREKKRECDVSIFQLIDVSRVCYFFL